MDPSKLQLSFWCSIKHIYIVVLASRDFILGDHFIGPFTRQTKAGYLTSWVCSFINLLFNPIISMHDPGPLYFFKISIALASVKSWPSLSGLTMICGL